MSQSNNKGIKISRKSHRLLKILASETDLDLYDVGSELLMQAMNNTEVIAITLTNLKVEKAVIAQIIAKLPQVKR